MQLKIGSVASSLALAIGVLSLSACDVPTAMPYWDTSWALPIETMEMSVGSLLPDEISTTEDGRSFELRVDAIDLEHRLSDLCDDCGILDGATVIKPHFRADIESGISLPAELESAQVTGGHLPVVLTHDFGFDPIRPSATARGSIEVLMTSVGDTLAAGFLDGNDASFPSGSSKTIHLPYRESMLRDTVQITVVIISPEGDAVMMDGGSVFRVEVGESLMQLSEVDVRVTDLDVDLEDTEIKVIGGEGMINRIQSGALLFEIDNPFEVSGSFQLTLSSSDISISREIPIESGHTEARVEFTGSELRSILQEEDAALSATGTVTATDGAVTVRPDQILKAKSRFDITIASREN